MIQIIPNFHPIVVHFPIALTMVAFIAALAAQLFKKRAFASHLAIISHYMLWAAAATVLVAISFGWLAYNSVNHDDAGHAAMTVHKFWAFTTAAVLVLLALFDFKKHQSSTEPAVKEGHDMRAMPMADEAEPDKISADKAGEAIEENHDTSVESKLPVQDEFKPHTHQHEHE